MSLMRVVIAGAAGGVLSIFTSWLITGYLFHDYQRRTPETWRAEGPKQYALSSVVQVLAGAAVGLLFFATGGPSHLVARGWVVTGVLFGLLAWLALACPVVVTSAVYVRFHRGVVVGLLLDSLVGVLLVSSACAWAAS
jgi:hypothetical protein